MRKVYYIKQTPAGRVFDAVNGIVIALLMFLMIYPFWNMLVLSFNDGTDALLGKLYFWPRVWTLANYEYVFKNRDLLHGALVSVLRVVVGTVTGVICNALLGYIVSCRQFYGRKFMRILFIITMYFGGGLIPTYLLMLELGFMNNFLVYIIPGLFSCYYSRYAALSRWRAARAAPAFGWGLSIRAVVQQFLAWADQDAPMEVEFTSPVEMWNMRPQRAQGGQAILGQTGHPLLFGVNGLYFPDWDLLLSFHGLPFA